jgi:hypothetical protein
MNPSASMKIDQISSASGEISVNKRRKLDVYGDEIDDEDEEQFDDEFDGNGS